MAAALLPFTGHTHAQTAVALGAGSYASSVPTVCGTTDSYYGLPAVQVAQYYDYLHMDSSLQGKPIPTNHWWTDMLIADRSSLPEGSVLYTLQQDLYGGNMWFYPGMLAPQSYGFSLYYPNSWTAANASNPSAAVGTIDKGSPIRVSGDVPYSIPSSDILIADFESGYPTGTTLTGNAFASTPSTGSDYSGMMGAHCANTRDGDNGVTGVLHLPDFTVQKKYVHFLVAGGTSSNTQVRLVVNGTTVLAASGQNDLHFRWVSWDVSAWSGQTAHVEVVDQSTVAWGIIACDEIVHSDAASPEGRFGGEFVATQSTVTNWGDWNVDFLMPDAYGRSVAVTMVRGIPFTWTTWNGMNPKIASTTGSMTLYNTSGSVVSTTSGTVTASALSFTSGTDGKVYGIFLPDNTSCVVTGSSIEPQLSGTNNYMVIGCLPSLSDLSEFATYAYAKPTNTQISWNWDKANGVVNTTWALTTTALKGSNLQTIQGWLPHHYRTTTNSVSFRPYTYLTARGTMKCAIGNSFQLGFPFKGIAPVLPAPVATGTVNVYQPSRMQTFLNEFDPGTMIGDTYWGGKELALCAQYMSWAAEMGDTTNFNRLKSALETAFANWLTYTPGETQGLFAYYPDWHALIGWDASYGSQAFNDLHFHYGYFATAAATLSVYDPQFVANYSPMLKAIVKCYGNYDRTDTTEPFLRTFDVWEGHSNAGGVSSSTGENQESSSEAVQSWGGMFLLGSMLNDDQMAAAGAMGFSMESAAANEYWQDLWQTNLSPNYNRQEGGIIGADGVSYGTYFSGDPAWVYAIQYCPSNHWLNYMTRYNLDVVKSKYQAMWSERNTWCLGQPAWTSGSAYADGAWVNYNLHIYSASGAVAAGGSSPDVNTSQWSLVADCSATEPGVLGDSPGHVVLCYQALWDPESAAAEFDRYFNAGQDIAVNTSDAGASYYFIHSLRSLGQQDFNYSTSLGTSAVYYNSTTGVRTYLVYNPSSSQQDVTVYDSGTAIGTFPVPANDTVAHHLDQKLTSLTLSTSNTAKTIVPGQTAQFTLTGYDQYSATYPLSSTAWSVSGGGTIDASGLFTATTYTDPVTVTGSSGGLTASYSFRVGSTPVLSGIQVSPAFSRVIVGGTQAFTASGVDQYGDAFALGTPTWATSGNGTVSGSGSFIGSTQGAASVTASYGGITGNAAVAVHATLANLAISGSASASSITGANVAANAIDGNTGTRWESQSSDNQWIAVDLGKVYDLSSASIQWETAYASSYDLQVSTDGSTWKTVQSYTKADSSADTLNFSATGRYVRLNLKTRATGYGFSIWEFQLYGFLNASAITPSTVLITPGGETVLSGKSLQFTAYALDNSGNGGSTTATWSVSGGGTVGAAGLFTAETAGGPYVVTAAVGTVSGTNSVSVITQSAATNVALNKTATASSSESSSHGPSNAVDGNTGTRWSSGFTDSEWLTVDLGASVPVTQVLLRWEGAYGKQYQIQASDDNANWTTLATVTNGQGGNETVAVSGTGRYIRMQGVQRGTGYGYSLWEFEVYSPATPAVKTNMALNGNITASSTENVGTPASNANDGSLTTRWSSASTDSEWITVDLGSIKTISEVTLRWETAYGKSYTIQTSNDGSSWSTLYTMTNGTGGVDDLAVSGTGRYVRIQGVARGTGYGYSLWEFEVR
ncbi:MAG: discoidin domain-containing protein [Chthoniobacteraceae bacterium]